MVDFVIGFLYINVFDLFLDVIYVVLVKFNYIDFIIVVSEMGWFF